MWSRIKDEVGDIRYGEIALASIELDRYLKSDPEYIDQITAMDWEFLDAVRYERDRFTIQQQYNANQKLKKNK